MGPIWPAVKSARAQRALIREYLRACRTGVRDFEDAEKQDGGEEVKRRRKNN